MIRVNPLTLCSSLSQHANVLLYLLAFLRVLLKQTLDPKARAHQMDSIGKSDPQFLSRAVADLQSILQPLCS